MKKVLTIGGATQDIFIHYATMKTFVHEEQTFVLLEEGKKIEVDDIVQRSGGGATNAAVSFQHLGFDVSSFFKVGNDCAGSEIIKELQDAGINVSHTLRNGSTPTGTSIIIPSPSGNRTVLVYRGANLKIDQSELPTDAIAQADHLYITSLSGTASKLLPFIVELAKQHNTPVAINPGSSQLVAGADILYKALPNIDILIFNAHEASLLLKSFAEKNGGLKVENNGPTSGNLPPLLKETHFDLRNFFKEALSCGPRIVAVTNGPDGVYVASENNIYYHPSLPPKKPVSTLGAGDSFGSSFVAHLIEGAPVESAMIAGIINASSVIMHLDAKTGLLDKEEIKKRANQVDAKLLQNFSL